MGATSRAQSERHTRASFSFGAGPTMLPPAVLAQVREDLVDFRGSGFSILEVNQTDVRLLETFYAAEQSVRDLLSVPVGYHVLFLHGGASHQFAMVPMNFLSGRAEAGYVHTGLWSGKAIHEARRFGRVAIAATTEHHRFARVPRIDEIEIGPDAAYLHYTPSETVQGLEYGYVPDAGAVPLVADFSSSLMTDTIEVERFGLLYASAQKNLGATGLTIVVVRDDLIDRADPGVPTIADYAVHARNRSRYSTPPVFGWYLAGLMLDWIGDHGGVAAMAEACRRKAALIYTTIDASSLYRSYVEPSSRSRTSIPFQLSDPSLEDRFAADAEAEGLHALRGHSSAGGFRASLYLGMPYDGAEALAAFLRDFEANRA